MCVSVHGLPLNNDLRNGQDDADLSPFKKIKQTWQLPCVLPPVTLVANISCTFPSDHEFTVCWNSPSGHLQGNTSCIYLKMKVKLLTHWRLKRATLGNERQTDAERSEVTHSTVSPYCASSLQPFNLSCIYNLYEQQKRTDLFQLWLENSIERLAFSHKLYSSC